MDVTHYNDRFGYLDKIGFFLEDVSSEFYYLHDLILVHWAFLGHELLEESPVGNFSTLVVLGEEHTVGNRLVDKGRQSLHRPVIEGVW